MIDWIGTTKRLCGCSGNKINCLTAKEWVKATIPLWEVSYRSDDIRDKSQHPATFPINLAKRVIETFSHKGDIVVDPFMGSGTTLVACNELYRHGIGIDLKSEYCNIAKKRLGNHRIDEFMKTDITYTEIINDDCLNIDKYIPPHSVDLVFTSPPYANLLDIERKNKSRRHREPRYGMIDQYSDDPRDFGKHDPKPFADLLTALGEKIHPLLKPLKHFLINIGDITPVYIQRYIIPAMNQAGYILWNNIIWDKRKLYYDTGIFGYPSNFLLMSQMFEYIFDFVRVSEQPTEQPTTIHGHHTTEYLNSKGRDETTDEDDNL